MDEKREMAIEAVLGYFLWLVVAVALIYGIYQTAIKVPALFT